MNLDEAAAFLGVSLRTFLRVLHTEDLPCRKVGREWKFSRSALVEWVASGRSRDFLRGGDESGGESGGTSRSRGRRRDEFRAEED